MAMKYLALLALFLIGVTPAYAQAVADPTATLVMHSVEPDPRVRQLEAYLTSHSSPIASEARHFINEADRLNLDWRLVAAISGVESTFGKHIPTGSFNAWGWGVFTGQSWGVNFKNWTDGITQVSEGLKYNYVDRGAETVEQIGRIYAASPAWPWKVRFFLSEIEGFVPKRSNQLDIVI